MTKIDSTIKLEDPKFIKPILINYTHKSIQRKWEAVISHDSVAVLLYHTDKKAFTIVKQLRAPVLNANKIDGYTYELCAGIIDKNMPDVQIAQEEILEECGYDVPVDTIEKITSFYTAVGISGAKQTVYYAQIDASMKLTEGGGLQEEDIEVIYIPLLEAKKFIFDESFKKTPGLMMAFYWFFEQKRHKEYSKN